MAYAGGLLDCFSDMAICCHVYYCPLFAHAENVALINEEQCGCCHCINCYSEFYVRRNIAKKIGEPVDDCNDFCAACFCSSCLKCQNQRALKLNGANNNQTQPENI